jgi:hypothetical protein
MRGTCKCTQLWKLGHCHGNTTSRKLMDSNARMFFSDSFRIRRPTDRTTKSAIIQLRWCLQRALWTFTLCSRSNDPIGWMFPLCNQWFSRQHTNWFMSDSVSQSVIRLGNHRLYEHLDYFGNRVRELNDGGCKISSYLYSCNWTSNQSSNREYVCLN